MQVPSRAPTRNHVPRIGTDVMQDSVRPTTSKSLPRLGDGLARLRSWENDFRVLAGGCGFSELNLPLSLPSSEFVSCLTGETTLPVAPRFFDTNATEWSLRSDLTLFSAQFVCRHKTELQFPFKLFYSGKVFLRRDCSVLRGFDWVTHLNLNHSSLGRKLSVKRNLKPNWSC